MYRSFRKLALPLAVCGVIGFGAVGFSQNAQSQGLSAEILLARDLKAGTKSLSQEIRIYHYFPVQCSFGSGTASPSWCDSLTRPEGRRAHVTNYLKSVTARFWDVGYRADQYINAGPGLYLAIDPHIAYSQKLFGTTVIELRVPAGTPYVNVVKAIPISQATLDALVNEGFLARHQLASVFSKAAGPTKLGFYRDTLKNMTSPGFEHFRRLVMRHFSENGIQFIEYNWDSSLAGFCRRKSASAFVFIGTESSLGAYSDLPMISSDVSYPNLSAEEREFYLRAFKFRGLLDQISSLLKRGLKIPKDLIVPQTYSATELGDIKKVTFGCD